MTDTPTDADAFTTVVVKETKIGSVLLKNAILLVRFDRRAIKNGAFNRTIPVTVRATSSDGTLTRTKDSVFAVGGLAAEETPTCSFHTSTACSYVESSQQLQNQELTRNT